jgi:hypothetical protein
MALYCPSTGSSHTVAVLRVRSVPYVEPHNVRGELDPYMLQLLLLWSSTLDLGGELLPRVECGKLECLWRCLTQEWAPWAGCGATRERLVRWLAAALVDRIGPPRRVVRRARSRPRAEPLVTALLATVGGHRMSIHRRPAS